MNVRSWLDINVRDWNSPVGTMAVRVAGMGVNFGVLAVIARWAGQESLGIIIALNGAAFLGGVVCSLGVPTLMLKVITGHLLAGETAVAAGHYRRGMKLTLLTSLLALVVLGLVALGQKTGLLPAAFGSMGPAELLAAGVCSLGMAVQFVGLSAIRAMKQPALSGFFQFWAQPLLLLAVLAAMRGLLGVISPSQAVLALSGSIILNATLVHVISSHRLPVIAGTVIEVMPWSETRSMWFLGMLSSASANIPVLLGAVLLAPVEVAVLGVPFRICNLPMTVVAAMGAYYSPLIREAHLQGDYIRQKKELMESQWLGAVLVLPVLLIAVLFPDWLLGLFKIHDLTAVRLLLFLACAQLLIAGCGVSEQYLSMLGASRAAARLTLIFFVSNLTISSYMMYSYGVFAGTGAWALFATGRQIVLRIMCSSKTAYAHL